MGELNLDLSIDNQVFGLKFLMVPSKLMDIDVVTGEDFCLQPDIQINRDGLSIRKIPCDE